MVKLTRNGKIRINYREYADGRYRLKCNFKCSYCMCRGIRIKEKAFTKQNYLQNKLVWDELAKIEDDIFLRINLDGEALADKWARECCYYINKIQNIKVFEIVTNNSVDPIKYLDKFDLTKTCFNCSFHPEFISLKKYIENILILKKAGCEIMANVVCIPQIIKMIPKLLDITKRHEIDLKIVRLYTPGFKYYGKQYPKDYNKKERRILKDYYSTDEEFEYFVKMKKTKGLNCYAGVDMVNIFMDGTVKRCFTGSVGIDFKEKRSSLRDLFPLSFRERIVSELPWIVKKFLTRNNDDFYQQETTVSDLITGRIKLKNKPYPCHADYCITYAHLIGLKDFRDKYPLSEKFADSYILNK